MLLLFIVIPCTLVGAGVVLLLDRGRVLPRLDRPGEYRPSSREFSISRPISLLMIVLCGTWILAWLVVLALGLNIILASS